MNEEIKKSFENNSARINTIIESAANNKYSSFYKKLKPFKLPLMSYDEFLSLPILTKEETITTPIKDRTFVNENDVAYYSWTSGTTNTNKPLIVPRTDDSLETFRNSRIKELRLKKILLMFKPSSNLYRRLRQFDGSYTLIPGDINNIEKTAFIVKEIGIDAVETSTSALYYLIQELEKQKYDLSTVRWVSIGGEHLSKTKFEFYKSKFPNALIETRYSNSESGGNVGYQCKYLSEMGPDYFHLNEDYFLELLDTNNNPAVKGEMGQIVLTQLVENKPFPVIRYATGDYGEIENIKCKCGESIRLRLIGKPGTNAFGYGGMIFHSKAIEYALDKALGIVPKYELHLKEIAAKKELKLNITLYLDRFESNTKELIQKYLFLSQSHNLKHFLDSGIVSSFVLNELKEPSLKIVEGQKIFFDK